MSFIQIIIVYIFLGSDVMIQHKLTQAMDPSHSDMAKPLAVQRIEQSLRLNPLLNYVENLVNNTNR